MNGKPTHRLGAFLALLLAMILSPAGAAPQGASAETAAAAWAAFFSPDPGFAELGPAAVPAAEPAAVGGTEESYPQPRLAEAAFLASGTELGRLPAYEARLSALLAKLASEAASIADPAARGEAVLAFLHREALVAYEADATTLDLVLDKGRYNCVSSALLYIIAARSLGLDVIGIRTPDHAFCVLRIPRTARAEGREIDVETTNRYGFDPGNKKEFKDSFGRVTGYAYAPPGAYSKREKIEDLSFVGLVLSNRAGILERRGRFREALRLGIDLDALAPGPESRAFLLDRVNNVAADLSRRGDFPGAKALAEAALARFGFSPRLVELYRSAALNEASALAQAGRWEETLEAAAALLAKSASPAGTVPDADRNLGSLVEASVGNLVGARLREKDFRGARALVSSRRALLEAAAGAQAVSALELRVSEAELAEAATHLPFSEALAAADKALAAGNASRARWEELVAYLYGTEANRLAGQGELLAAAAVADKGAATVPAKSGALRRFAGELRRAFAAGAHNEFARLYNGGDYAGALRAVQAALDLLPGDATLSADIETARRAAGSGR